MTVGIMGLGVYTPSETMNALDIAKESGIPEEVIRENSESIKKPSRERKTPPAVWALRPPGRP